METWPCEISFHVFQYCDFSSLLHLRQSCSLNKIRVEFVLLRRKDFSFRSYQHGMLENRLYRTAKFVPSKMTAFFYRMPQLTSIILSDLPCLLTFSDMIQLGNSLPRLESITFDQGVQLFLDKDVFLGLTSFKSLKNLKIIGWEPSLIVKRGCVARFETLPSQVLMRLRTLEIICNKDTVSRVLEYMQAQELVMHNIEHVRFDVRHSSPDIPHLTMQFIAAHPHLKTISFNGFLFTTQEEVAKFYEHLVSLHRLERLSLINCSVIDRIESSIQNTFLERLRKKGIVFNNIINSLRHL